MYRKTRKTENFDMNIKSDREAYDKIVNDPLKTIVQDLREKVDEKIIEDGQLVGVNQRFIRIITWEGKSL